MASLAHWRLVAAILVLLGLVLPMSKCTRDGGETVEYHYIIKDALDDSPRNNLTHDEIVRHNRLELWLSVAAFCWPLAAMLPARRRQHWVGATLRRVSEPVLIAGSAWWLHVVILLRSPAIGYYVVSLGLVLYSLIWVLECAQSVHRMHGRRP